jgi:hypothetical protein
MSGDAREALVPTRFVAMIGGTEIAIESNPNYMHFAARHWTVTNRGNGDQVGRSNGKDGELFWWRPRAMDGGTSFDTPEEALAAARSAY